MVPEQLSWLRSLRAETGKCWKILADSPLMQILFWLRKGHADPGEINSCAQRAALSLTFACTVLVTKFFCLSKVFPLLWIFCLCILTLRGSFIWLSIKNVHDYQQASLGGVLPHSKQTVGQLSGQPMVPPLHFMETILFQTSYSSWMKVCVYVDWHCFWTNFQLPL